ncbi:MAG: hypothetical protein JKY94_13705 [Rhodobacteraceae bacterium]|nr:hypothetical protein [Paracoccaceae bacterium]
MTVPSGYKLDGDALGSNESDTAFSAKVYADGALFHQFTSFNAFARLSPGLSNKWEVEITGKVRVSRITMGGTVEELMG